MPRHGGNLAHVAAACALLLVLFVGYLHPARATTTAPTAAQVAIPAASYLYRFKLEREVASRFDSTQHVARIAAQVHAESRWEPMARSAYAEGMSQFTPATSQWLQSICPEIGPSDPWDPNWSVRAVVCYDAWLYARVSGSTECDRWAFSLSAYNGGLTWVLRDQKRAEQHGAVAAQWFDQVERYSARAQWAIDENRDYVRRILKRIEPAYINAGWPGVLVC